MVLTLLGAGPQDRPMVPVVLQVELLGKVLRYDRNFSARAGAELTVLVAYSPASPSSRQVAKEFAVALGGLPRLAGLPHRTELVSLGDPRTLAALVAERHVEVVVFAGGVAEQARELGEAFSGTDCLTVSASPEGVKDGLVLGFDLVSGKPRMLLNLTQARKQHADFRVEVLQLMTVYP